MALLFLDGFDHSDQTVAIHATKYPNSSGNILLRTAGGGWPVRTGAGMLAFQFTGAMDKTVPAIPMGTAFIAGFAFRKENNNNQLLSLCLAGQGGVAAHLGVAINGSSKLFVYRGSTATVLGTGTSVLMPNAWYYIEFKGIIDSATGSFEVRLDGVAGELSATNVNTRNGGTGVVDTITLHVNTSPSVGTHYFDDFYICDNTGSAPTNTFLGPVKIETLLPQSDTVAAGSHAGLTPSTGTNHGALVDEVPPNATDYNSSTDVGTKDTYQYPSMTIPGTILGVQTNLYAMKTEAASRQGCAVVRVNGVDYDGASVPFPAGFAYRSEVWALNPNTGVAWTTADIATMQAGMKVTV